MDKLDNFRPLTKRCGCGGRFRQESIIEAKCHDLTGVKKVLVTHRRCVRFACRSWYGHNYFLLGGEKRNYVSISELTAGVLFINNKMRFTVRYIKYHLELFYHAQLAAKAVKRASEMCYGTASGEYGRDVLVDYHKAHASALLLYLAMQEFELVN